MVEFEELKKLERLPCPACEFGIMVRTEDEYGTYFVCEECGEELAIF